MVRIDGSLVRKLREEKGLTQLYLATAVEVTTDTISRWENRHYQSVKMENGLRLAAALEVDLNDILESTDDAEKTESEEVVRTPAAIKSGPKNRVLLFSLISLFLVLVVSTLVVLLNTPEQQIVLSATRKTPSHAMPGHPFPVVITVETNRQPLSVVIKEFLPAHIRISSSSASLHPAGKAELKWIAKHLTGSQRFGYMVTSSGQENLHFNGIVTSRAGRDREIVIGGMQSLAMAPFHWADSDKDGIISDDEILVVYDEFDDVPGLTVNIDLIDEIWMASGYKWNTSKKVFAVIP